MKALLIDPDKQTIQEVDYTEGYAQLYDLIGARTLQAVRLNRYGDFLFVDEEGALPHSGKLHLQFRCLGPNAYYPSPLIGRGLVLGTDKEGETTEPHVTLDELKAATTFKKAGQVVP